MAKVNFLGLFPHVDGPCVIREDDSIPVGAGTGRPLGLSLEAVMALYWKVRSWKFYHPWTQKEEIIPAMADQTLLPLESEEKLVCGYQVADAPDFFTIQQLMFSETYDGSQPLQDLSICTFYVFQEAFNQPYVLQRGDLYYPRIVITWETNEINIPPVPPDLKKASFSYIPDNDPLTYSQRGEQQITILDQEYSIPLYSPDYFYNDEPFGDDFFYSGEISVNEYWQYD